MAWHHTVPGFPVRSLSLPSLNGGNSHTFWEDPVCVLWVMRPFCAVKASAPSQSIWVGMRTVEHREMGSLAGALHAK
jgi:hypothetical protein